jgi:hypothetical protein
MTEKLNDFSDKKSIEESKESYLLDFSSSFK